MRARIAAVLLLFTALTVPAGSAKPRPEPLPVGKEVPELNAVGLGLMDRLAAHPTECPADMLFLPGGHVIFCGAISADTSIGAGIAETVDAYLLEDRHARAEDGWADSPVDARRDYSIDHVPFTVRVAAGRRVVVAYYPKQCFPPTLPPDTDPEAVFTQPHVKRKAAPDYPRAGRGMSAEAQVLLQTIIRADGRVGDLCLLHCTRPGLGFEEAAAEAVKGWRYAPARLDGEPISIPLVVLVDFRLH